MLDCWHETPDDRPSFERLHQITTGFLQEEVKEMITKMPSWLAFKIVYQSFISLKKKT